MTAAESIRTAISESTVGEQVLFDDLHGLDAIGEIRTDDGTAVVEITLPIPSARLRRKVEADVQTVALGATGIHECRVDWTPDPAARGDNVDLLPNVKNVIAVASGKGGVGKSTVAANLVASLADSGVAVGLLDADIYGPNAPTLLGATEGSPSTTQSAQIEPKEASGVQVMSMDFIVDEDDPIIWRGPMVDDVLHQLTGDVDWGDLDYLVVDLPPGTGDAQLTLVQHLPVTGAVIVTTPQAVAVDDARRGLEGFAKYGVPILGVVENMHSFVCPDCETDHDIFGSGGADAIAEEFDIPVLGRIPLDPELGNVDADPQKAPGFDLPVIGRVGLPRTENERTGRQPPAALRDTRVVRSKLRELATRTAARCQSAVIQQSAPPTS